MGADGRRAIDGGTILITGASSGIGMAIARLVAPRAKRLVLVARRAERMEALGQELVAARPELVVDVMPCDLSKRDDVTRLIEDVETRGLAVDVLVNNAGVGMMTFFEQADAAATMAMVDLNVTSVTMLTRAFLPAMVARRRGGVLNVSSGFGLAVLPMFAAYIASKHYVTGLTEALRSELVGSGVVATQVCPGPVATEFESNVGNKTGKKPPALVEISAEQCARAAIAGFDRGRAIVVPGTVMKVVMLINALSPRFARRLFASIVGRIARKRLGGMLT